MKQSFLIFLFIVTNIASATTNLVVFSFNRPLQLWAFLESFEKNVTGCNHVSVVYRADDLVYQDAYNLVKEQFSGIDFLQQSESPRLDFKPLTIKAIRFDEEDYIIFAVDDIIITRPVDLNKCVRVLEDENAHGFYLRLGKNITHSYMEGCYTGKPKLSICSDTDCYKWKFSNGKGDWGYPQSLDLTLFRKADIKDFFLHTNFTSPNTLEGEWNASIGQEILQSYGICFENSCMVNCPFNLVQADSLGNRHNNNYSAIDFLNRFNKGFKLDIEPLQAMVNNAPHINYYPKFVIR